MNRTEHELSPDVQSLLRQRLADGLDPSASAEVTTNTNRTPPLTKHRGPRVAPLSFAQQRLWFLEQLVPGSPLYNLLSIQRLAVPVDPVVLERSLNFLSRRHDSLRTGFTMQHDQPVQKVVMESSIPVRVVDLTTLTDEEKEAEARRLSDAECQKPFDLTLPPLVRATLLKLSAHDFVFLLNMHHIISDGWSLEVLWRELLQTYESLLQNKDPDLPELTIQYPDHAESQRQRLTGEVLERHLGYWKRQLKDLPVFRLPADKPRSSVQSFRGRYERIMLPAGLASRLRAFSQAEGVTLFMTLLAAFKILLVRYTDSQDTVIGSPIAGRDRSELQHLIGFFVNTIVLRTNLEGNPTFREAVHRVEQTALDAYAHQDLPFEMLVEKIHPDRDLGSNPLFQVMFQLLHQPVDSHGSSTEPPKAPEVQSETSKFDLSCSLSDTGKSIGGSIEYSTDLFEKETIQRLIRHYRNLLNQIAANPDLRIRQIDFLSRDERRLLLQTWNETESDFPNNVCVHERFEEIADRFPSHPATEFDGSTLSYRELNQRANELAEKLRASVVGPGDPIGICAENSPELIVGILAILKAGGAYLPLDPLYPRNKLVWMLEDVGAQLVLTDATTDRIFNKTPAVRLLISENSKGASEGISAPRNAHGPSPDDIAYVMYTSGSTGTPKGIGIPHRAILRLVCNTNYIDIDSSDRVTQASNCAFDASTFEIWGPLLNGAQLVHIPKATTVSPSELAECLVNKGLTTVFLTTALFNQLAHHVPSAFSGIRHVIFGGEAADPDAVGRVLRAGPPDKLIHAYGPTECTTYATTHLVTEVPRSARTVPIGQPIANTSAHVLDSHLELLPIGVPGELYVGGAGLAQGYWNRPEFTASRFVPDPFSKVAGGRLYRTGDTVRRREDGALEFLGRRDRQVKLRGFRIELGEIEGALRALPSIQDGAVVLDTDSAAEPRLVAFCVPNQGEEVEPNQLLSFLRERLPDFMIPSQLVPVPNPPLTPNGKLDRDALSIPESAPTNSQRATTSSGSKSEQLITAIWMEILEIETPDLDSNFFDLGGHSILLIQVQNRLVARLGRPVPMLDLFQYPTIRTLAAHLDSSPRAAPAKEVAPSPEQEKPLTNSAPLTNSTSPKSAAIQRTKVQDRASRQRGALDRFKRSQKARRGPETPSSSG